MGVLTSIDELGYRPSSSSARDAGDRLDDVARVGDSRLGLLVGHAETGDCETDRLLELDRQC
jgi:hypothetical protein